MLIPGTRHVPLSVWRGVPPEGSWPGSLEPLTSSWEGSSRLVAAGRMSANHGRGHSGSSCRGCALRHASPSPFLGWGDEVGTLVASTVMAGCFVVFAVLESPVPERLRRLRRRVTGYRSTGVSRPALGVSSPGMGVLRVPEELQAVRWVLVKGSEVGESTLSASCGCLGG